MIKRYWENASKLNFLIVLSEIRMFIANAGLSHKGGICMYVDLG